MDERDFVEQTDYTAWSLSDLLHEIEQHADMMRGASRYNLSYIMEPATALAARAEETAALRAELDAAQNRAEAANRFAAAAADRVVAEMDNAADAWRRVAELEAELAALKAATEWRPGSDTPPSPCWYQTAEDGDGSFSHAYFDGVAWLGYPGNQPPMWYRPIPPLPQQCNPWPGIAPG